MIRRRTSRIVALLLGSALVASVCDAAAQAPPPGAVPPPPPVYYGPPPPYYQPSPYGPPAYAPPMPAQPQPPMVVYDWDPDVAPPKGYHMVEEANGRLIGVGVGLFSSAWVTSVFAAAIATSAEDDELQAGDTSDSAGDWTPLYIPVVGPFLAIGTLDPKPSGLGILVADGVMQGAGVLAIVLGFVDKRHKIVRHAGAPRSVAVSPAAGPGFQGLQAKGRF